jgi:hypothetical protein
VRLLGDARGAVLVEFLVVFLLFLTVLLCLVQHALLGQGHLAVQRAASAAARAAAVVLDDDPAHYGGEPRLQIQGRPGGSAEVDAWLSWAGMSGQLADRGGGGTTRLGAIRAAALFPLLAVSSPTGGVRTPRSVAGAIGAAPGDSPAVSAARYARAALAVVLLRGPGERRSARSFQPGDPVTVRVSYAFHCGVPLARLVMCRTLADLAASPRASDFSETEVPWRPALSALRGARFRHLRAEHSLPIHAAPYEYQ